MNELDGEWYEERNPITLAPNIDIPVWLQIDQGRGWTMDGTIELFHALNGPKKLDIGPYPPMQSRPFVEEHDKMFRWYDYWLKGIDNGVMDEPAVSVFVEGSRETVTGAQWPPKDVEHRPLYLRPRRKLSPEPEPMGAEYAAPDGFYQAPLTVTDKVEILSWSTAPFERAHRDDRHRARRTSSRRSTSPTRTSSCACGTRLPTGSASSSPPATSRRRTASSTRAHHRGQPVPPAHPGGAGRAGDDRGVRAAALPVRATFLPGHKLVVELSNDEPLADEHNALLPPDAFHLPVGRPVTHKIYRDAAHPSRIVLPFTRTVPSS